MLLSKSMTFVLCVLGTFLLSLPLVALSLCSLCRPSPTPQSPDTSLQNSLSCFSPSEQTNTLGFLRGFASTIPDLESSWVGDNYCSWTGVHCRGGGVTVNLAEFRIRTDGASLPELAADVDGAQVAMTHLYLYHQGAKLQGSLPASWSRLDRLESLMLMDNALTGPLPDAWGSQGKMKALRSLMLSLNAFSGTLPSSWTSLWNLHTVVLASNAFEGPLPPAWGEMPVLFLVDVSGNHLCGCVPEEWSSRGILDLIADAALTASNCSTANTCSSSVKPQLL